MVSYKRIQSICIMYILVWMIAPPLSYDIIWRLLAAGAALIWILLQMLRRKMYYRNQKLHNSSIFFGFSVIVNLGCLIFTDIFYLNFGIVSAIYNNITTIILFFAGFVSMYYVKEENYNDLFLFFRTSTITATIFSITSTFRSDKYHELTRAAGEYQTAAQEALTREAAYHGVGAFGFFCLTSVLATCTLWMTFVSKEKKDKRINLITFIIMEAGVISAGYTLALSISLIGIICCLFFNLKSRILKFEICILGVICLLFGDELLMLIYKTLSSLTSGGFYENKVQDIFSFLLSGESTGSFDSRAERYLLSLNSLIKYPVWGSYILAGINATGRHSSILDTFAAFGWLPGICWVYAIGIYPSKLVLKCNTTRYYKVIIPFLMILTGVFNSYAMTMGVLYFVLPSVMYYVVNRYEEKITV